MGQWKESRGPKARRGEWGAGVRSLTLGLWPAHLSIHRSVHSALISSILALQTRLGTGGAESWVVAVCVSVERLSLGSSWSSPCADPGLPTSPLGHGVLSCEARVTALSGSWRSLEAVARAGALGSGPGRRSSWVAAACLWFPFVFLCLVM